MNVPIIILSYIYYKLYLLKMNELSDDDRFNDYILKMNELRTYLCAKYDMFDKSEKMILEHQYNLLCKVDENDLQYIFHIENLYSFKNAIAEFNCEFLSKFTDLLDKHIEYFKFYI